MSQEYAENRIKDALRQTKGNPTKARQKVIAWTFEDPKLLQALARPHLTGVVAHAVNRVIHKLGIPEEEAPEAPASLDMTEEAFGQEILKALQSGDTAMFGQESAAPRSGRKQASQSHIDAIQRMAQESKKKSKDSKPESGE